MAGFRGTRKVLRLDRPGRGDVAILETTRAALTTALGDDADELSLRIRDGVVTIRGEVERLDDIVTYETIVRRVSGVVDVDNLLRLRIAGRLRPRVLSA